MHLMVSRPGEPMEMRLKARREKRALRLMPVWEELLGKPIRQYVETIVSLLAPCSPGRPTRSHPEVYGDGWRRCRL